MDSGALAIAVWRESGMKSGACGEWSVEGGEEGGVESGGVESGELENRLDCGE